MSAEIIQALRLMAAMIAAVPAQTRGRNYAYVKIPRVKLDELERALGDIGLDVARVHPNSRDKGPRL